VIVVLTSIAVSVFHDFHLYLLLIALCIFLGLAYRRHLGMKHIWHWRGLGIVVTGLVSGLVVGTLGLDLLDQVI
jgi:hypothetical protein